MHIFKTIQLLTILGGVAMLHSDHADAQHAHRGGAPDRYESEGRDEWQMPESVIGLLELKPGMVVADIGAASGYFSRLFSTAVGSSGRVLAVDLDTEALAWLADRAAELGMTNIDTVHAEADDSHLPSGEVDLVFFCNTLHHISHRADYLKKLKRALAPGARLAVIEYYKRDLPVGPQGPGHKLSRDETRLILGEAGYRILSEPELLPYQYFIIASPE